MDILEQYAEVRFRIWSNQMVWVIYEACPEDGPGVSKKLIEFTNKPDAERFLELHRQNFVKWCKQWVRAEPVAAPPARPNVKVTLEQMKAPAPEPEPKKKSKKEPF